MSEDRKKKLAELARTIREVGYSLDRNLFNRKWDEARVIYKFTDKEIEDALH